MPARPEVDLQELRRLILSEIDSYRYEVPAGTMGRPHSNDWVVTQLAQMRASLVEPEWRVVEIRDTFEQLEVPEQRECVLVAVDSRPDAYSELYYDPVERDFCLAIHLAGFDLPQAFGVRGDAVGCFMAR